MIRGSLKHIKAIIMDVDGVLTDGRIIIDGNGVESKFFDVQDGFGIVFAKKSGLKTGIISARPSPVTHVRAKDLNIDKVFISYPKITAYQAVKEEWGLTDAEICFIGDDLADLKVMKVVGFAAAVNNAVAEIKQIAHYVTEHHGGRGAVREVIEHILKAQGKWGPDLYEH